MDELVKVHPLYSQLARLDDDMQALQLRAVGSEIARSGADIAREEKELQHELDVAANATKKALADKQQDYARREQAAIAAALGSSSAAGPSGGQIAGGMVAEARAQAQGAAAAAQHNFDVYRRQLIAQDEAATRSLDQSLAERADRTYQAEVAQLQKQESDYALQQASADAAERLSLQAKLSNLALDDETRADVKKQLQALDQKEADAVGAMKNRDSATLADLQKELHDRVRRELETQAAQIHKRTVAKIAEREEDTRRALEGQIAALPLQGSGSVVVPGGVSPEVRAKLEALHQKYQDDFNRDASQTIAQFQKTRSDLTRRFQELEGVDATAQAGAGREMDALQKQRGELYEEMVDQIGREVKTIAQRRGIGVVVSDVVAPAGGVDLTADAEKDIESLHE
jgi:hypothetical protein